jgi:cytochrome c oxidase assembly protein subunit 15
MAVPDWPTTYGYNMFLYPWQSWLAGPFDLFIEHGHRLLGAAVGMLTIALVIAVWLGDSRHWMRGLSIAALAGVILQGSLGGMRVVLDRVTLAKIHGCVGPLFFATTVAIAVMTSRRWREQRREQSPNETHGERRLQRLAFLTMLMAYIQLVLGAQLRHLPVGVSPSEFRAAVLMHVVFALVVTGHVMLLAKRALSLRPKAQSLARPAAGLVALIGFQLLLGLGAWISKYGWPQWLRADWLAEYAGLADYTVQAEAFWPAMITTAHVATGSLIIATSLVIALRSVRMYGFGRALAPQTAAVWRAAV